MERTVIRLNKGYKFKLFDSGEAEQAVFAPGFDDGVWQDVRVPHDWAAAGEFREENDLSYNEIIQDGIVKPIKHSGRTGALPTLGTGVYRLWLDIPEASRDNRIFVEFDGVMWESDIYVNGEKLHHNHFGYRSFSVEITSQVKFGEKNLLAVAAHVFHDCSRWYPGAGIFRNVYLVEKAQEHIRYNGVWVRQLEAVPGQHGTFLLTVDYEGDESVSMEADIISPDGDKVCEVRHGTYDGELSDIFMIPEVQLWDIGAPKMYTADVRLINGAGETVDNVRVRFGARNIEFTVENGFFINGRHVKLNGVCNHHDLGSLGAAVNVSALKRQLKIMQDMGVNSIRTSHNPPAPELLELCDELGIVVMDEFFDEWLVPKVESGYAKYFKKHAVEDAEAVITRDRNHPCVIMWSIGNEIGDQRTPEGWRAAKLLADVCRRMDPTRPITAAFDSSWPAFENHLADFVDIVGINYKPHLYREYKAKHPGMKFIGTETASCVSTRGVYDLPAEVEIPPRHRDDLTVSAYELAAPPWAYYPEREFAAQDDLPYVAGEYVWTGFDYLGEPTPYYSDWPARSSYFGAVDIAGLPKNRFYSYKARWTDDDVLHIFPHWNWEGHEGTAVPVHVFASYKYSAVELFVNGVSQGRRSFDDSNDIERYRLIWNDVKYVPGEVKAVAYDAEGNVCNTAYVRTAGEPHHIELSADRNVFAADGEELIYITAKVVDENGTVCPKADNRLFFTAEGAAEILTTDAGDPRETESFARADKKALAGMLVCCVRSVEGVAGEVTIRAAADGIDDGVIVLKAE